MKQIQELIKRLESEINKTPTGELRNLLCDANIVLQQQALNITVVVGQSEQLCVDCNTRTAKIGNQCISCNHGWTKK